MNVAKRKSSVVIIQLQVDGDYWKDVSLWPTKEAAEEFMPEYEARFGKDTQFRYIERTTVVTDKLL